ncbi:MAG TPA: hypothetical protein VIV60_20350 [Polyangiaceae bacterium]
MIRRTTFVSGFAGEISLYQPAAPSAREWGRVIPPIRRGRKRRRTEPMQVVASQIRKQLRAGQSTQAITALQPLVREGPYDEGLHYALGSLMLELAAPDQLIEFFATEIGHDDKPQTDHYFIAMGFAKLDNTESGHRRIAPSARARSCT